MGPYPETNQSNPYHSIPSYLYKSIWEQNHCLVAGVVTERHVSILFNGELHSDLVDILMSMEEKQTLDMFWLSHCICKICSTLQCRLLISEFNCSCNF
jgi:hypothetical protein